MPRPVSRLGDVQPVTLLGLPAAVALGVAASISPKLTIVGAVGLLIVALVLTNLTYGVGLFTVLTFFEQVPGLEGVTLTKPMGLILVLSWLGLLLRGDVRVPFLPRDRPGLAFLLATVVALGGASVVWATDPAIALSSAIRLMLVVVLFFIVFSAVRTDRDVAILAWSYLTGAFLVTTYSIAAGQSTGGGRLSGEVLDPNYLAAVLVSSTAIAGFMLARSRGRHRLVLAIYLVVFVVALVLTESRGGLLAGAVVLVTACFLAGPYRARAVAITLVAAALGIGYYAVFAPEALRERVTNISAEGSASRTDTWNIAIQMTSDEPLVGVGLGSYPSAQLKYLQSDINLLKAQIVRENKLVVHNTYLEVAAELGLLGLGLFATVIVASLAAGRRGIALLPDDTAAVDATMRGLLTGTVGLLAAYVFISGEYEKHLWLLLGLACAFPHVARSLPGRVVSPVEQ